MHLPNQNRSFVARTFNKQKQMISLSTIDMDLFTTIKRKANSTEACG